MILIVSENEDHSTSQVIQWLIYYKAKFVRVNKGDTLTLQGVHISNNKVCRFVFLSKERGKIDLGDITAIWYRRGGLHFHLTNIDFIQNRDLKQQAVIHLKNELNILEDYLQYLLPLPDSLHFFGQHVVTGDQADQVNARRQFLSTCGFAVPY